MRKCKRGVGMSEAIRPIRSLFMYPGQRRVVVLTDITVDTYKTQGFLNLYSPNASWQHKSNNRCFRSGKLNNVYDTGNVDINFHYRILILYQLLMCVFFFRIRAFTSGQYLSTTEHGDYALGNLCLSVTTSCLNHLTENTQITIAPSVDKG